MAIKFKKGFFVVGTDTDIGKTYVSTLLYKALRNRRGGYYKPVQSGCMEKNGRITAPDVEFLCNFNNIPYDCNMVTYGLKAEVSPHLAAELENVKLDINKIEEKWKELKNVYEYMIVEGAGGLYVPLIRDKFYIYDLIKLFNLPVILVSSLKVGSINHAILTVENLKKMGIPIHGIVFNRVSDEAEGKYYEKDNMDIILKLSGIDNYLKIKNGEKSIDDEKIKKFLGLKG